MRDSQLWAWSQGLGGAPLLLRQSLLEMSDFSDEHHAQIVDASRQGVSRDLRPGRCYLFDGIDDYADCGDVAELDFTSSFSVMAWIKCDSAGTIRTIVAKDGVSAGWGFVVRSNDRLRLALRGSSEILSDQDLSPVVADGTWHHVVGVATPTSATLYVDGALARVDEGTWTPTAATGESVKLGDRLAANTAPFAGYLFDVRLFDSALTPTEVATIYESMTRPERNPSDAVYPSKCVAHWKCDEWTQSAKVAVYDSSGNGRHGSVQNINAGPFYHESADVPFSWENEAGFNQFTAADLQAAGTEIVDANLNDFTTGSWTKHAQMTASAADTLSCTLAAAESSYAYYNGLPNGSENYPIGDAYTFDLEIRAVSSDCVCRVYMGNKSGDGPNARGWGILTETIRIDTEKWTRVTVSADVSDSGSVLAELRPIIYFFEADNVGPGTFSCQVRNVKLYSGVHLYEIPQRDDSPTLDLAGRPIKFAGPCPRNAKLIGSHCVTFDALDDHVAIPDNNYPSGNAARTICQWVKIETTGDGEQIYQYADGAGAGQRWQVRVDTAGSLEFAYNSAKYRLPPILEADGLWHHVAAVVPEGATTTDQILYYIDGVLVDAIDAIDNPDPGGSVFTLTADSIVSGTPVLGSPTIMLNTLSSAYIDSVPETPYASWSLNKTTSTATQAVLLRRADNAELAFGFDGDSLDVAAIETWAAGQDAFIKTIYDQTGNGHDFTHATEAEQPQLVVSGSVNMDDEFGTIPQAIIEDNTLETAGLPAGFSRNDITIFTVQTRGTNSEGAVFSDAGAINGLELRGAGASWRVFVGSEILYTFGGSGFDDDVIPMHRYGWVSGLHAVTITPTNIKAYRNRTLTNKFTGSYTGGGDTKLYLGSIHASSTTSQRWTETIIFPALSDTDLGTLTDARNVQYGLSPTDKHNLPELYITEPWCQDLYEEMLTVVEDDVDITLAAPSHDGTYVSEDQISNLQLDVDRLAASTLFSFRSPARYFVLDDGNGAGLLANNTWRLFNYGSNTGSEASVLGRWYATSMLTNSGVDEGNPHYQNAKVGMRAMMLASANLLGGLSWRNTDAGYNSKADFVGGLLEGTMFAFLDCKSLVSQKWRDAIYNGALWYARIIRQTGARHDNANMDLKCLPALAALWVEANSRGDTAGKLVCTSAARKVLFGSDTGTLATSEYDLTLGDYVGVADPAGHIRENGAPETTYQGHSTKEEALAYSLVFGESEWSFLLDLITAQVELEELQTFDDITTANGENFQGPSGYSSRTSGSMWQGQGNDDDKFLVISSAQSKKHHARHRINWQTPSGIASSVQTTVGSLSNAGVAFPADMTGTAAAHTNGYDWSDHTFTVDTATNEIILDNAHGIVVDDIVCPFNALGELPDGLAIHNGDILHVIAVSGQRIKVSTTQGGSEINIVDNGRAPSYSPHYFLPLVYLTDSPDISWTTSSSTNRWAKVGSVEGRVWEADNTNKIIAVETIVPAIASGSPVDYEIRQGPREHKALEHWPYLPAGHPPVGWHATLKALVDGNDSSTFLRTETEGANYNVSLADLAWGFRGTSAGGRDYAFYATGSEYGGANDGFHPAMIEAVAFEDYGIAAMSRRGDKDSADLSYSNIDRWVCWHTWGKDDKGTPTAFSTLRGNLPNGTVTYNLGDATPNIVISRTIGQGGAGGAAGLQDGDEITGTFTEQVTLSPATNDDGLRVELELSSDQSDSATELWHTIPIYLREADQAMTDALIQYWDAVGETWQTLTTTLASFRYLRTVRNHGPGDVYVWYDFLTSVDAKLSSSVKEQVYQGSVRSRNVLINVHSTNPGSVALLPSVGAPKQLNYEIIGTDPGLAPTSPTLTVLEPVASDIFWTNGFWYAKTTIDFYDTNPGAILEYSTNSTDGSDGTWTAVGSLTNTTENEWVYLGEGVAVPSGLTYVRIVATDDGGSSTIPVAVSSATPTLNLDDPFTAADGTAIDGSYAGWATNNLSAVWLQNNGVVEVQSNQAKELSLATWNSSLRISTGSNNAIVQAEITFQPTSGSTPGHGVATAMVGNYYQMNRLIMFNSTKFRLYEDASNQAELTIGSAASNGDVFRLTLQQLNGVLVGKIEKVTGGLTTLGYLVNWTPRNGAYHGLTFRASVTTDNCKIWT